MKITPINGNTETEGSEFVYRGNKLLVARSGNTNFKKMFRELIKPYREEVDGGRMSEEQSNEIMIKCVASTILVGWETITDTNGEKFEFSKENAMSLLTDDKDAYDEIIRFSENIDNYLTASQETLTVK